MQSMTVTDVNDLTFQVLMNIRKEETYFKLYNYKRSITFLMSKV